MKEHNCDNCQGKIILIELDELGIAFCGYCGGKINMNRLIEVGNVKR
jgi:DNA-directed RNA polymerase subunit RPC12/RpoP